VNDFRIIDADGHVQEKDAPWQDLLEAPYKKYAPRVLRDSNGRSELLLEGKIWAKPTGINRNLLRPQREDKDWADKLYRPACCHFERREKSYPLSLKSFQSGLMLSTNPFFFSRRHFFISFSLAKATVTSPVSSK